MNNKDLKAVKMKKNTNKKVNFWQKIHNFFVFDLEIAGYLENFMISAVSAIIGIRVYLALLDYPKVGGGGFHIAHMLWGGMLMFIAIVALLSFLNKEAKNFASVVGGFGFGLFIDELGKFVTSDNNYFFEPAIALIYVLFVSLLLFYRLLERTLSATPKDYAVNALEVMKEVVLYDLDEQEKNRAIWYLKHAKADDPVTQALKKVFKDLEVTAENKPHIISVVKYNLYTYYMKAIQSNFFATSLVVVFVVYSLVSFFDGLTDINTFMDFWDWGHFVSSSISSILAMSGVYFLMRTNARLKAYQSFKAAILIQLLITQFFLFYFDQLAALSSLVINISLYTAVQYFINQERIALRKIG